MDIETYTLGDIGRPDGQSEVTLQPSVWTVKPTEKGMQTQHGGPAPSNPDVAYFVYRLADTTTKDAPVSSKELIEAPDEERIFTYATALEAQRLGYVIVTE